MSRITEKYRKQISKSLDMDEIGIKVKSQRPKDILNETRSLAPFDYIFKRADDSIYYHLIPKYRRQLHEHIPKNATKSEIDLNCQVDELLYKDMSMLTLIYLLRKKMSLTQQLLCKIDNDYHDMIMDLIDDKRPDISMILNIYPQITPQSLCSYLNVLAAARNASTVLYTTRNPEPKMCNFIVAVRNLIMSIYPSSRRINRNIIKIKNEMQERQSRILCEQDGMSNDEHMSEIISSYSQSDSTEVPKFDTIIINTDDIPNLIAQDNKYTKSETTYLSTRNMNTELQGLFSVEYLVIYSFYVEIVPYINLYFAFRIQSEHWQTFLQAFKTELNVSTNKITNSIVSTPTHLPRNSHGITCILSDDRASEWVNQLLIAPMQSSNVSPASILIDHKIPTDSYNIEKSVSQYEQLIQSEIDDPKVIDMMTTCIQTVVHALSQRSRLLIENLNDANKVILEQQHIIDTNSEKIDKHISLTEYDNLVRELNQTKQQLNYEQQRYLNLSKELAPYENLKWKSQELQNQLDMQMEINSEIEEQLENAIEQRTDTECEYDEDTFTEFLRQKNVFIVGGHEHWRCDMQSILPDAKIVVPEHNNASVDNAKNADYIIINTGMLNHPMFRKVRAAYQSNSNGQVLYLNTQASNMSRTLQLLYSQVNIKHLQ